MSETKGKAKEIAGFLTGDRKVEAAGRVERLAADPDSPVEEGDEQTVAEAEHDVRRKHRDVKPAPSGGPRGLPQVDDGGTPQVKDGG